MGACVLYFCVGMFWWLIFCCGLRFCAMNALSVCGWVNIGTVHQLALCSEWRELGNLCASKKDNFYGARMDLRTYKDITLFTLDLSFIYQLDFVFMIIVDSQSQCTIFMWCVSDQCVWPWYWTSLHWHTVHAHVSCTGMFDVVRNPAEYRSFSDFCRNKLA